MSAGPSQATWATINEGKGPLYLRSIAGVSSGLREFLLPQLSLPLQFGEFGSLGKDLGLALLHSRGHDGEEGE